MMRLPNRQDLYELLKVDGDRSARSARSKQELEELMS